MTQSTFKIKTIILTFVIGLLYVNAISPIKYPDNKILEQRIFENSEDISLAPQIIILDLSDKFFINDFCNKILMTSCKKFILNSDIFLRIYFFVINFFIVLMITWYSFYEILGRQKRNKLLSVFFASLSFPSVLLGITSISPEATYTIISIFCLCFFNKISLSKKPFFLIGILAYSYLLDSGNLLIFLAFMTVYFGLQFIHKISSQFIKFRFFIAFLSLIIMSLFVFGKIIFFEVGSLINSEKTAILINNINNLNLSYLSFFELLERFLYFLITFSTLYFADHTFSITSVIFTLFMLILFLLNLKNKIFYRKLKILLKIKNFCILYVWLISFPIIVINILPTHAYGKYYLFYIVFILKPLRFLIGNDKLLQLIFSYSLLAIIEILFLKFFVQNNLYQDIGIN